MTTAGAPAAPMTPCWATKPPDEPATGLALDLWRWTLGEPHRAGETPLSAQQFGVDRRAARDNALRRILARYLACGPGDIVLGRSPRGRPFVEYPPTPLDFNLSDSRDTVVLAVTRQGRVGVDIEYHRGIRDPMAIARRVLPTAWIEELADAAEHEQATVFFSLWTRFEACQKAIGQGIFAPRAAHPRKRFGAFLAAPGCSGHVCIAGLHAVPDPARWRCFDYRGDD